MSVCSWKASCLCFCVFVSSFLLSCIHTLRWTGNMRRAPTYTLIACWGWYTVKGHIGVLIQTARWMAGSPSYIFHASFTPRIWPFPMTTLWRALHWSKRGHSWENEGLRGERLREGGMQCQLSLKCHKLFFRGRKVCTHLSSLKDGSHTHTASRSYFARNSHKRWKLLTFKYQLNIVTDLCNKIYWCCTWIPTEFVLNQKSM